MTIIYRVLIIYVLVIKSRLVDLLNYIIKTTPTPNVRTRNKKAVTDYRYGEGGERSNTSVLVNTYTLDLCIHYLIICI